MTDPSGCPFCRLAGSAGEHAAFAFDDGFPVADGHRLVVPRRHVARVEDLEREEWTALFDLVRREARTTGRLPGVDGVTIGVNSGTAAGQTVDHAHVHVIPRRAGDVDDPRGGVRWVLPERADYWTDR